MNESENVHAENGTASDSRPVKTTDAHESFPAALRRFWEAFIGTDRTQLSTTSHTDRALRFAAWTAILSMFMLGWGASSVTAVSIALGNEYIPKPLSDSRLILNIALEIGVSATAAALIISLRYAAGNTLTSAPWRTQLKAFPVAMAATAAGFAFHALLSSTLGLTTMDYPSVDYDTPTGYALNTVLSMMAGPSEELALMALVVTALRTTGYSWTVVCITAIVVRVPFHIYYGWGAVGLSLWAVLIVALYRRTNALLAIIAAHAAFNGLNFAGLPGGIIKGLLVTTGGILALVYLAKNVSATKPAAGPLSAAED